MANSGSENVFKILELAKNLAEDSLHNYSLAVTGGFIRSALKYFERAIEKNALMPVSEATDPDQEDITYEEQFYIFAENFRPDLLLLHAKVFGRLMKNPNVVKWVSRNMLVDLRYAFMVVSAAMRGSQGVDESVARDIMGGLGEMLKNKEAVMTINKNSYISNWFFYRMFEVGDWDDIRSVQLILKG